MGSDRVSSIQRSLSRLSTSPATMTGHGRFRRGIFPLTPSRATLRNKRDVGLQIPTQCRCKRDLLSKGYLNSPTGGDLIPMCSTAKVEQRSSRAPWLPPYHARGADEMHEASQVRYTRCQHSIFFPQDGERHAWA
jgi:hypothetical protein